MSLNNMGLGFTFTAKDMATSTMDHVEGSFHKITHAAHEMSENISKSFMAFGGAKEVLEKGMQVFEAFEPAIKDAHEFEAAIALVSTRVSEAQYPHELLAKDVTEIGIKFGMLPTDEAKVFYDAVANGADDSAKMTGLMTAANELATATQGDLQQSMSSTAELLKVYGISFEDATEATDRLFVASSKVPGGLQGMESILDKMAPVAKQAGVGMDQLLGYVEQLSAAGIQGRPAVAGLKAVIDAMITHGPNILAQSVGKTNLQLQKMFGSTEGATVAMALMRNGGSDLAGVMDELAHAQGKTAEAAEKMLEAHPEKKFAALSAAASKMIGEVLLPLEEGFFKVKNAVLEAFLKIPKPIVTVIVKIAAALAGAAGAALLVAGAVAYGSAAISALSGVFAALSEVMLPVIAVVGALALASYAFTKAWETNFGGIRDFLQPIFDNVKMIFVSLYELFSGGGFTADTYKKLEEHSGIKNFAITVFMWVSRIENFFEGLKTGIEASLSKLAPTFHMLGESITRVANAFGLLLGGKDSPDAAAASFDRFGEVGVAVATVVGNIFNWLANVAAIVMSAWLDYVSGVVSGFQTSLGPAVDQMSTVFGFLWDQIKQLLVTLGIMTESTVNAGSGWQTFGKIVGFVGGIVVQIVGGIVAVMGGLVWLIDKVVQGLKFIRGESPADVMARLQREDAAKTGAAPPGSATTPTTTVSAPPALGAAGGSPGPRFGAAGLSPTMTSPALASAGAPGAAPDMGALTEHLSKISKNTEAGPTLTGVVVVDGEQLAKFTAKQNKSSAQRSGEPSPVET
jgi:hypothetical protein